MAEENQEEVREITVEEVGDREGKEIGITLPKPGGKPLDDKFVIISDFRCIGKDSPKCDECMLRFDCYLNNILLIDGTKLNLDDISMTLNEKVELYIRSHRGVEIEGEEALKRRFQITPDMLRQGD